MPYLAHFGLKEHPFTLTPNVDYYYPTQETANIVASLDFALRRDSGIIKVVGEVGTGKTLLCRLLMHKLEEGEKVAYINAPQADARSIVRTVCEEFGVEAASPEDSPYGPLNRFLVETHEEGKLAVVVVDEAQHLGRDGLEAVRLISNLETERRKLLQIVLFGQTELDDLLADPSLRQLNQRVAFSFQTRPFTVDETRRYIVHRIKVSRQEGVVYDIYTEGALDLLARRSGGVPRVVNILADKSLLVAFSEGSPTVEKEHVQSAVNDTTYLIPPAPAMAVRSLSGWRLAAAGGAGAALALLAAGAAYAVLRSHDMKPEAAVPAVAPVPAPAVEPSPAPTPAPTPPPASVAPSPAPEPPSAPAPAPVAAPAPAPAPAAAPVPAPAPVPVPAPPPPAPKPAPAPTLSPPRSGPVE